MVKEKIIEIAQTKTRNCFHIFGSNEYKSIYFMMNRMNKRRLVIDLQISNY